VDDVVQEVLTEIHASQASFQPGRGDLVQWTRGIAWKVIRRHVQDAEQVTKRFVEDHASIDQHPAPDPSPERCVQLQQARSAISTALKDLSPLHFEVFVLHVVDDLSHAEISERLQLSPANAQKCFQRARDHLAECLGDEHRVVMPPNLAACEESISTPKRRSRWSERSHYIVQVATLVMAVSVAFSMKWSTQSPPALEEELVPSAQQNDAMYDNDKRVMVHDEPSVLFDAVSVKPEPASLPSVRNVSTPAKLVDKPAAPHARTSSSSYTFKYKADFSAHRPGNIR
jgi:RNA polymerase sigma factor (sigma-70 family)